MPHVFPPNDAMPIVTKVSLKTRASRRLTMLVEKADAPKSRIWKINEAVILSGAERVFARAGFEGHNGRIAEESGVPKPNLHYYFGNKRDLYRAVLNRVLRDWLDPIDVITADAEPRIAPETYIRRKMALAERPDVPKVFVKRTDSRRARRRLSAAHRSSGNCSRKVARHRFLRIAAGSRKIAPSIVPISSRCGPVRKPTLTDVQIQAVMGNGVPRSALKNERPPTCSTHVGRLRPPLSCFLQQGEASLFFPYYSAFF